ncbi:NAD(P)/FAD-dependent oxidoreductase [Gracilibacillus dipsosauri]|uniref:NAD(P)/FAD-dependent oxidoreductase n=1 Tax=Gracilibacillus dipsosauri TaxID=178340 RepID=UPI002409D0FD
MGKRVEECVDLIIIGGGTTGLFAAYYATMREMKVMLIEAQEQLGGKVMQFLPEKIIYDVGGFPDISGEALVENMIEQAKRHQPEVVMGDFVEKLTKVNHLFQLETAKGHIVTAKTVLIATGSGTFHTKRPSEWPNLPHSVFKESVPTTLMHKANYEGKKVVISSNSKVGVGWALFLEGLAKEVTLINPADKFLQVKDEDIDSLYKSKVKVYYQVEMTDFIVEGQELTHIEIKEKGQRIVMEANKLLTYHGLELQAVPFEHWGIQIEKGRIPVTPLMKTNLEGVFAAGDIVQYPGKTTLIASGYTEAITAVNHAHLMIDPKATEQLYSTVIYR